MVVLGFSSAEARKIGYELQKGRWKFPASPPHVSLSICW